MFVDFSKLKKSKFFRQFGPKYFDRLTFNGYKQPKKEPKDKIKTNEPNLVKFLNMFV